MKDLVLWLGYFTSHSNLPVVFIVLRLRTSSLRRTRARLINVVCGSEWQRWVVLNFHNANVHRVTVLFTFVALIV